MPGRGRRDGRPEGRHYFLLLLVLLAARPVEAAVADYIGRPIAEVHLRSNGVELNDPSLLEVVETRTGTPLVMTQVRETMAHLFGLGRYQDVQVDAAPRGNAVVLTYDLVPARRVRRIAFEGPLGLPESELRRAVVDRYGASPSLARAPQVVATLQTLYRDRGYPRARIESRSDPDGDPSSTSLVFAIEPGARARIGAIEVQGTPREAVPDLLDEIGVRTGNEYDGIAIDASLVRYADDLRTAGFFEARAAQLPRYLDDDRTVNLVLSVEPGPHVEIAFDGDPLSANERDQLVPIAREHSVDEDLLEDSKFGIERYFRERGFCNPSADYERRVSPGVLRVAFVVSRGPRCVLERADVTGNTSIPSEEISQLIQTEAGQPFIESTVGADAARIQSLYRQRGFSAVKVSSEIERGEPQAGVAQVRVRLVIAEGVRSVIQAVSFDGIAAIDAETLRRTVTSAPGQPYFEPQIEADADSLTLLYLNSGYPDITVRPDPRAVGDGSNVDLHFVLYEGPQILIDHVLIVGNIRTRTTTILREVQLKSGQPLSQQQEDDTRSRLTALGLFRRVDISYLQLPGAQSHRDVVITVEEAPVTMIGYGGGLEGGRRLTRSSDTGDAVEHLEFAPRGFFQVGRRNLFGKDRSLNLFTRVSFRPRGTSLSQTGGGVTENSGYGFNEFLTQLTYAERGILGTPIDATFTARLEQAVRSSFNFNRRSANAILARRLTRTVGVSGRYRLDHTRLFDVNLNPVDKPLIDRLFPQVRLSTFSGSLIRDSRDDAIEPRSGGLIGLDGEVAARRMGSEVGLIKTFMQGFAYRSLGGVVAAFGARLGLATGFSRLVMTATEQGPTVSTVVDDLPASERFYAGGDTTVRGFTLDRLGTQATIDADGFPKGGHGLIVLNGELRIPVRGSIGAVAFVDAGNVFLHVDDMDLSQLRAAVGFGIRYLSPVGPIRVDLGIKLATRILPGGQREKPTALHISLGQAF